MRHLQPPPSLYRLPSRVISAFGGVCCVLVLWLVPSLAAAKENPGGIDRTVECSFECWRHGYEVNVIRIGPPGGSHEIQIVKTYRKTYADESRTRALLGNPGLGSAAYNSRVKRMASYSSLGNSWDQGWCNWDRMPVEGQVNLVLVDNPGDFVGGEVKVGQIICETATLDGLVGMYNSSAEPLSQIPPCGKEGCLPLDKPKDGPQGSHHHGPLGYIPANQEGPADELSWLEEKAKISPLDPPAAGSAASGSADPEAGCDDGSWSAWLDRDGPGGSGDYETLRDHFAAGDACEAPSAVQCRTVAGVPWQQAGEVYSCKAASGGLCLNDDQVGEAGCSDYEVRFCC